MTPERQEELLDRICSDEGFEDWSELLEAYAIESVVPGACKNEGCTYVSSSCEPDGEDCWCEVCDDQSVVSCMVLGGVI